MPTGSSFTEELYGDSQEVGNPVSKQEAGEAGSLSYYTGKLALEVGEKNTNAALSWVQGESLYLAWISHTMDTTGNRHECQKSRQRATESPA